MQAYIGLTDKGFKRKIKFRLVIREEKGGINVLVLKMA